MNTFILLPHVAQTLGLLSSFQFAENIWKQHQAYVINHVTEATIKLRGINYYLPQVSIEEAQQIVHHLEEIIPTIDKVFILIENIQEHKLSIFKQRAIEFIELIRIVYQNLIDISDQHICYKISTPVFAQDWDSEEDQRWDNC